MVTFKKLRIFITTFVFLLALGVLGGFSSSASAATLGQPLPQPEEGWKRYDDTHPTIEYMGKWSVWSNSRAYGGTFKYATPSNKVQFNIQSTKIRVIATVANSRSKDISVVIDGVEERVTSWYSDTEKYQILVYEKEGLSNTLHTVEAYSNGSGYVVIDAIDIDADGYLVSPDMEPLELVGEVANNVNSLTWNEIENATYNIKRATTAGGPYTTIANELTTNSYIDSDVEEGVTYYYVVTAVLNGAESKHSNEVALTREGEEPAPQPEPDGNAKLTLHLVDNQIKEYEVTLDEVDRFSNWFDKRMSGTGQAYYVFELKHNISPYKTIKEYMVFDKIVWYEVKEY